jgi:hypothetical protein
VLGGGIADVGERPGPGGPVPAQVRPCAVTAVPGRRGRPGERRVLHAWLPPERAAWRPPAASSEGRRAPAGPGRSSPHLQKSGLRGSFSLSVPESGAGGVGISACYGRFDVPFVDLRCTWSAFPPVLAAPGSRAGAGALEPGCVTVSPSRGARGWGRKRLRLARRRGSVLAGGHRTGSAGPRRAGRLPVPCARAGALPGERAVGRATARQAPGRRGNIPGTGSPATGRPVPGQPAHPVRGGTARR